MLPLRKAALRLLSHPSASHLCRTRSISTIPYSAFRSSRQSRILPTFQRRWATDGSEPTIENLEQPVDPEQAADLEETVNPEETVEDTVESDVQTEYDFTIDRQSNDSSAGSGYETLEQHSETLRSIKPSNTAEKGRPNVSIYIGNLFYDVNEKDLALEFNRFGEIESTSVIRDSRGLSKGFGYVRFKSLDAAIKAKEEMSYAVFEGRRINIQFAINDPPSYPLRTERTAQIPSKTLYIGNMSYRMTDHDLNSLFKGIANVIDVRVSIDRRTGQLRGFAHADFIDVKSATEGMMILKDREFDGRKLRVNYAQNKDWKNAGNSGSKSDSTEQVE